MSEHELFLREIGGIILIIAYLIILGDAAVWFTQEWIKRKKGEKKEKENS